MLSESDRGRGIEENVLKLVVQDEQPERLSVIHVHVQCRNLKF